MEIAGVSGYEPSVGKKLIKNEGLGEEFYVTFLGPQKGFFWASGPLLPKSIHLGAKTSPFSPLVGPRILVSKFSDLDPGQNIFFPQSAEIVSYEKFIHDLGEWAQSIETKSSPVFESLAEAFAHIELSFEDSDSREKGIFLKHYQKAQQEFVSGSLKKIVLSSSAQTNLKNPSQLKLSTLAGLIFHSLLKNFSPSHFEFPFVFCKDGCVVVGRTPEFLMRTPEGASSNGDSDTADTADVSPNFCELESLALAGTAPAATGFNLKASTKDLEEHAIVTESLAEEFVKGSIAFSRGKTPNVVRRGGLVHLQTDFRFSVPQDSLESWVTRLHPTPALGGYPRDRARQILRDFEVDQPRDFFGAPLGVLWPEKNIVQVLVAIRCLEFFEDSSIQTQNSIHQGIIVRQSSGCGVVRSSDAQKEWEELKIKRQAVKAFWQKSNPKEISGELL